MSRIGNALPGSHSDPREKYKRVFRFFLSMLNVAIMVGIFAVFWFSYFHNRAVIGILYFRWGHYAILCVYAVMILLFARMFNALRVGFLRMLDVLFSQVLMVVFVNAIAYVQLALIGRWRFGAHLVTVLWMVAVQLIASGLWVLIACRLYQKLYPPHEMLLIYGRRSPHSILTKVGTRRDKYNIKEIVSIYEESEDEIRARMRKYDSVLIGDIPSHQRNLFLKYAFEQDIRCYFVPKISDIMMRSSETILLFDTAIQLCRNRGLTAEQRCVKRAMDIVFSLLMLIPGIPIMIVIGLCIKLYDGGPVFYRQSRLTRDGRKFKILKFRSMAVDAEKSGARLYQKNDARVTPVGRVIRDIHVDELPQLFNILMGDMSLVGPRPERPEIAADYQKVIPEFNYRLKVKAGLTGYAQVYGKYNTTPYDKLKLDLFYIENYSIFMDIKLCFLTFKILFQKENTEGVDAGQRTAAERMDKIVK